MSKGDNKVSKIEEYNEKVSNMQTLLRRLSEGIDIGNKTFIEYIQKRYTTEEAAEIALEKINMHMTVGMLLDGKLNINEEKK